MPRAGILVALVLLQGCIIVPRLAPRAGVIRDPVIEGEFVQVSPGEGRACGLTTSGETWCWRVHITGFLPARPPHADEYKPVRQEVPRLKRLAPSLGMSCGIDLDDAMVCWGQLGPPFDSGWTPEAPGPRRIADALRFTHITTGSTYLCGTDTAGSAWCWGYAGSGALGTDSLRRSGIPDRVHSDEHFLSITATPDRQHSEPHTCGVTKRHEVWCWGGNEFGQAGGPSKREIHHRVFLPRKVPMPVAVTMVAVAGNHSCGLSAAGEAWCWGSSVDGAIGVQHAPDVCASGHSGGKQWEIRCARQPVPVATHEKFTSVTVAAHHACGLTADGHAWCWGSGRSGMLEESVLRRQSVPRRAPAPPRGARYTTLASGADRTCATTDTGDVHCWRFTATTLGDLEHQKYTTKYFLKQTAAILLFVAVGWGIGRARGHPKRWTIAGAITGIIYASLWFVYDLLDGLSKIK